MAHQQETCDFALHTAKAKKMDWNALVWTIQDCLEAARIHDEMDRQGIPNNSGRYWDEYFTYTAEMQYRRQHRGFFGPRA